MDDILDKLEMLTFVTQENLCLKCSSVHLNTCARTAYAHTKNYFNGLCLDCMDKSRPSSGDEDKEYWQHCDKNESEWIYGCRVRHR